MLTDYILLLPEFLLLAGMAFMSFVRLFRHGNTPKTFYTIGRNFLLLAAVCTAVFYNQGIDGLLMNNYFTTLFKLIVYLLVFVWNYLSLKHFQSKNRSSFTFYLLILFYILGFSTAVSAENIWLLFAGLVPPFIANYFLFAIGRDDEADAVSRRSYLTLSICNALLFFFGVGMLHYYSGHSGYQEIERYLETIPTAMWQCNLAFALIMVSFLLMLGCAPFHFWFADTVRSVILPVGGFIMLVPPFVYFACIIDVLVNLFYPISGWFAPVMLVFGCLSVFLGALGSNGESNLRKIFAYFSLYNIGVLVLSINPITDHSLLSTFIYLVVYVLAMAGVYTVFLGMRSKGIYLADLGEIRGFATRRPFVSAAFLLFMISLIGTPPLLGFLGKLSIVNNLVLNSEYWLMIIVTGAILLLANACLKIITALYFEPRNNSFDSVDKGVYICILINMLLIAIAILNPRYLMHDVEVMLVTVL